MVQVDSDVFKKAWYSFEEIGHIIESEEDFNKTGISYNVDEAFKYIKSKLFSKNTKCIR